MWKRNSARVEETLLKFCGQSCHMGGNCAIFTSCSTYTKLGNGVHFGPNKHQLISLHSFSGEAPGKLNCALVGSDLRCFSWCTIRSLGHVLCYTGWFHDICHLFRDRSPFPLRAAHFSGFRGTWYVIWRHFDAFKTLRLALVVASLMFSW